VRRRLGTKAERLRLRLDARPESVPLLRERLCLWLEEVGANADAVFDLSLAVTEAFTNALEHPREPTARVVEVQGTFVDRTVSLVIRDYGSWGAERQREEGGYGLPLIKRLVDVVEIDRKPEGTSITLRRGLNQRREQTRTDL
jgi:anti-sigma regulatory factor (Ser/Thr protein kinase)